MATSAVQSEALASARVDPFDHGLDTACDGQNDGREVSLEQYLSTIYTPDCDYVDGHLEERNLGEFDHGDLQSEVPHIFRSNVPEWRVKAVVETRLQVRVGRFRVPDVMVLHPGQKKTQIVQEAPLICVEIFSPQDRWNRLREKVDEYVAMGVRHIWAFDPVTREAYPCDTEGFHKVLHGELSVAGTAICLKLADVFGVLDSD